MPGINIKTTLEASEDKHGASILTFLISKERIPVNGYVSVDNRGTKSSGPIQISTSVRFSNLTGYYEDTGLTYVQTSDRKELQYIGLDQSWILNSEGTKLSYSGMYSKSEPGTQLLRAIELDTSSNSFAANISHPFIRSRQQNLSLLFGFQANNNKSKQLNIRSTDDRVRKVNIKVDYDYVDSWFAVAGISQVSLDFVKGLPWLGSTSNDNPLRSRVDGKTDFFKIIGYLSRIQDLANNFQLQLKAIGQYSDSGLVSGEEYGIGGEMFGRAYDPSEITGDDAAAFSVELRYNSAGNYQFINSVQPYVFYDIGYTWDKKATAFSGKEDSLSSLGVGLRVTSFDDFTASLEIAKPLTKEVYAEGDDGYDLRGFFRLAYIF